MKNITIKSLVILVITTTITSCVEEYENADMLLKNKIPNNEEILILKERNNKYPLDFPQRSKARNIASPREVSSAENDLGNTYKLNYFPLGTAQNLGIIVANINKLKNDFGSAYVKTKNIGIQTANSFSYTTFERYTHKSKDTEKITHGINLDIRLFSIGNQGTIEKIYTTDIANETNRAYGQLDINIIGKRHTLEISSNSLNKIKLDYLDPTFRDELYSITMGEFIKQYGALVLTNFFTGGRVTALYSGIYSSNETTETKEKNIDESINASYGSKQDTASGGGNFGIGRKYFDEKKMTTKFTDMTLSIKAIGGNLSFPTFSSPQEITQVNIDLSSWMSSMSSPDSYKMIDIESEGLHPLSEFVLEENLKRHINDYLMGYYQFEPMKVQEPYIEILRREIQGFTLLITTLVTKNEDRVLIDLKNVTDISESLKLQYINDIANQKSKVYGLKIIQKSYSSDLEQIPPKNCFQLGFFDENLFSKYIDSENNTMYLLYNGSKIKTLENSSNKKDFIREIFNKAKYATNKVDKNGVIISTPDEGKYGLSIYKYKRTLNLYGLTDFVNKLPTIDIDKEDLLDYEIVSL